MEQITFYGGNKHGTTTGGKLDTIKLQTAIFDAFRKRFNVSFQDKMIYGLPGPWRQVPRHLIEYANYGFYYKNQNLIEKMPKIYDAQKRAQARGDIPKSVKLIRGDAYIVINEQLKTGQVGFIDFDKCASLEQRDLDLIENAAKWKVDGIILTCIVKTKLTPFLAYWKRFFGFRRRPNRTTKTGLSNPIRDISIQTVMLAAQMHGFSIRAIPYRGRTQMCSFILTNETKYLNSRRASRSKAA